MVLDCRSTGRLRGCLILVEVDVFELSGGPGGGSSSLRSTILCFPESAEVGQSGATLGHLGAILGPSWGHLGATLRPSWAILGPSWAILGTSWGHLGPSWGHLGPSWASLGPSWGHLGAILGPSWGHLGPTWGLLKLIKAYQTLFKLLQTS